MKKIAFTVIALLGLGTASFAQNSYDGVRPTTNRSQDLPRNRVLADNGVDSPFLRRFGFGVKVGLNVSSMSDLDDSNSKPGFTAGVFADYRFNDWFALSADLLYSREGTTIKSDGYKQTMKSNYLNIPILANFYVLDKLAFKVGVQPGIFLSAKIKDNSSGNDETVSVMSTIPESDRVNVAYLLGGKGTNTIAKNSYQGQVVDLVANNVADLGKVSGSGAGVEISMEQLALWDPQLILFAGGSIYDSVGSDAAFAELTAVKNGSYYEVPSTPWNWLNNPPTVNQVLGMQWLPRLLYPDKYDNDLYETVSGYFKTFYGYDLSKAEFDQIAAHAQPKA